jgi:hypothetical protein
MPPHRCHAGGYLTVRVERKRHDHQRPFGERTQRIVGAAHDQRGRESVADLQRGGLVRMRVIPVRACAAHRDVKGVEPAGPRRNRIHGAAVLVRRNREPVPMDGRFEPKAIGKIDRDPLSLPQFDHRPGKVAVVAPQLGRAPDDSRSVERGRNQPAFELVSSGAGVFEDAKTPQR